MTESTQNIVIAHATRTALGRLNGQFKNIQATGLGAHTVKAHLNHISAEHIQGIYMGTVLPAGLGQAPARQVALKAGLNEHTHAMTLNRVCGSGMQSVMMACNSMRLNQHQVMVAGGMENMSQAPYLIAKPVNGARPGHQTMRDHLFTDGLEDAYDGQLMGVYAEKTAEKYGLSRHDQDAFAIESLNRAQNAAQQGYFDDEISPYIYQDRTGDVSIHQDENLLFAKPNKIPHLKPAFLKNGTITAANASSISDGAASLLLMTTDRAKQLQQNPLAKIVAYGSYSHQPAWFTTAPIEAIKQVAEQASWSLDTVDLFEINEAFAVVTMAAIQSLKLDPQKVNIHGGACALGHPIGASGARILVTLIHALKRQGKKRGIASLCIGGGEATAMAIEIL